VIRFDLFYGDTIADRRRRVDPVSISKARSVAMSNRLVPVPVPSGFQLLRIIVMREIRSTFREQSQIAAVSAAFPPVPQVPHSSRMISCRTGCLYSLAA
jgi:hypothetical protein